MNSKKVLVISYYFPPMGLSGVQRTLKFVKYLPQFGWEPVVLTSSPKLYYAFDESLTRELAETNTLIYRTGDGKRQKKDENSLKAEPEQPNNSVESETDSESQGAENRKQATKKVKTRKFPSYLYQKLGSMFLQAIYQPDSKRRWLKKAIETGRKAIQENKIEVIFATAPPFTGFLAAKALSLEFNIPFILDYRDVWVDNPFHYYITPFHKLYSIGLESDVLDHAERAIVTTRNTKELLLKRYKFLSHTDIDIVSHGFDPDDFVKYAKVKSGKDKFIITHSGLFQDNRTPKFFLLAVKEFFRKIPEAKTITELRFIGLMRKNHSKMIKKYGLADNCLLTGYLNHNDVIGHLTESDVLWFMSNDTVRSPGKIYEYIGARKPILACLPEGVISRQLEESHAAYITTPKDVKSITKALMDLYKKWKSGELKSPDDDFVNRFDRKTLTGELAKILALATDMEKNV